MNRCKGWLRLLAILICSTVIVVALHFAPRCYIGWACKSMIVTVFIVVTIILWSIDLRHSNQNDKATKRQNYDWGMHYFRAFAILIIMATHYCSTHKYYMVERAFFTASTIYFLFISGYLCQYIDKRNRVSPGRYYSKKLINVVAPFVLFSIIFGVFRGVACFSADFVFGILLGRVQNQYWYIPFVSGLFLVSPILCRCSTIKLIVITIVTFVMFLMFPIRPGEFCVDWPNTFYLYAYFSVFYILGFVYCRFREDIDAFNNDIWPVFFLFALIPLVVLLWGDAIAIKVVSFDLIVGLQRLFMVFLVIKGLSFIRDRKIWLLDKLATYSFTLYFIHFGIFSQTISLHDKIILLLPLPLVVAETIVFGLYVMCMLIGAILFKTAIGRYSRMFIGA